MRDVIIVGGGPAGLSAALILGRCRRRVLVIDSGTPRNMRAKALHGFLSRDGIAPRELQQISREQLAQYKSVELRLSTVLSVTAIEDGFSVCCSENRFESCRKLLLATGMQDVLPTIEGLQDCYGISVHHCPYCDGWEVRDQPLAVLGSGEAGRELARKLLIWSPDVVLCSNGPLQLSNEDRQSLLELNIRFFEQPIARLKHESGELREIEFVDGNVLHRRALFFCGRKFQHSKIAESLGCRFDEKGYVCTGTREHSSVPGVFVAGDASGDVQLAIMAAADGVSAAIAINNELAQAELDARRH